MENQVIDERANPRWINQWITGVKPGEAFDKLATSPVLLELVGNGEIPNGRALVPGCGRGYDVITLASNDRYAIGLDLSEVAVAAAIEYCNSLPEEQRPLNKNFEFIAGNFFELSTAESDKFNFIYDYTFLCALHPSLRNEWAQKMSDLIHPNGELCTLIFPIGPREGGPPFEVSLDIVKNLLIPVGFEQIFLEMLPDEKCHAERKGMSGLGRWRKL